MMGEYTGRCSVYNLDTLNLFNNIKMAMITENGNLSFKRKIETKATFNMGKGKENGNIFTITET